jgi:regulation of enolase protein 1 (concanavalin A-like superfamily)
MVGSSLVSDRTVYVNSNVYAISPDDEGFSVKIADVALQRSHGF